jgi:hypothetical protein
MIDTWKSHNGAQPGDPAKLARALVTIIEQDQPPLRFVTGADAIEATEGKAQRTARPGTSPPRHEPHAISAPTSHTTTRPRLNRC